MDPRAGAPPVRDLVPSALPTTSRMAGEAARVLLHARRTAGLAVIGTSRMAGDHHGARPDAFVLGLALLLAAPCAGSLPP
jgi:hypothetical protein